jgi:hypothetical protein
MINQDFKPKRITRTYCQIINSTPGTVFPLLCPVREAEWLDGWNYRMIYSRSGLVEEGAVFSTSHPGEEDTIWMVVNYNPEKFQVDFARVTPKSKTCLLKIAVRPKDEQHSFVDISYTYTAIAHEGNEFIAHFTESEFLKAVTFWEKAMNVYLETGTMLKKEKHEVNGFE